MPYHAETIVIPIDPHQPDPQTMALAGQIIRDGGLVAFPTETVYGLGANALSVDSVKHIFEAKGRPANDPLIVHIWQVGQLDEVAMNIPDIAQTLANTFWPGPLTMILRKQRAVPSSVTAGLDTVAVRLPAHPVAQALIRKAGCPIAAPSANRFSRPSPTRAAHVRMDLEGHVDLILDGGNTAIGVESTIIDLTIPTPTVLRPGGISLERIQDYVPSLVFEARYIADDTSAPSPGTLLKHYSPRAQVIIFKGSGDAVIEAMCRKAKQHHADKQRVGIMACDQDAAAFEKLDARLVLLGNDDESMALCLFAGLRTLDEAEVDVILVRAPQPSGIGLALYDRLIRAAEGHVIDVDGI